MRKIAMGVAVLAVSISGAAVAGEKLTKEEVLALVSGSKYEVFGGSGNQGTINSDGTVSASNPRDSSDGKWKVLEDGQYCNEWHNSRWTGSCAHFERTEKP